MSNKYVDAFSVWYGSLKLYAGKFPAKGTISGALVVLERLKTDWNLSIEAHTASGGSQIAGASGSAVRKILADNGELRPFVSEGGRTNRGLRGDISRLLKTLDSICLAELPSEERTNVLGGMQRFLVDQVGHWHNQQRIELVYDDSKTTRDLVHQILVKAREKGQFGPVAQYLVGAKLQLRYPTIRVDNDSFSTADTQLGRSGDYVLGDTAFHVTVSPMDKVYERCERNLLDGMHAYLLVPQEILHAARINADSIAPQQISVESIESFVGGNVDELASFSRSELVHRIRDLILKYNERVDAVEIDKSMLIELPHNLSTRVRRARTSDFG